VARAGRGGHGPDGAERGPLKQRQLPVEGEPVPGDAVHETAAIAEVGRVREAEGTGEDAVGVPDINVRILPTADVVGLIPVPRPRATDHRVAIHGDRLELDPSVAMLDTGDR